MRISRLLAAAAVVLAAAGCADRKATLTAPDTPSRAYITSVSVQCPGSLAVGASSGCQAYAWDSNGNYSNYTSVAAWGSSNYNVLNVGFAGSIYGISAGTAQVSAQVDNVRGYASVNVYTPPPPPYPSRVTVSPGSATVATGQSAGFTAKVYDQNGNLMSGQTVTWSSSNTSVATVNSNGYAQGVSPGSATITATAGGASGTAGVSVVTGFNVAISGESVVKPNHTCSWFAEVSGGVAPYSYAWFVPAGSGSSVYEPSSWTGSSSAGTFTIYLTVTDGRGVQISTTKQVSTSTTLPSNWECYL